MSSDKLFYISAKGPKVNLIDKETVDNHKTANRAQTTANDPHKDYTVCLNGTKFNEGFYGSSKAQNLTSFKKV